MILGLVEVSWVSCSNCSQDVPHPILDASEEIVKLAVGGRIGLPLSAGRLFIH